MDKVKKKKQTPVFNPAKMSVYKNKGQRLASLCPWVLMVEDGIVLLKNRNLSQELQTHSYN